VQHLPKTESAGAEKPELLQQTEAHIIQVIGKDGQPQTVDIYTPEGYAVLSNLWTRSGWQQKASYEPTWLGIPIIQLPEDILMMQELLWRIRPDVVIESGVAHGGALVLYASILSLLGKGRVIGIDIEIRKYNRLALQSHPMSDRITLIEGDATAASTVEQVRQLIHPGETVLVALDSNHAGPHVSKELEIYAPFVKVGGYIVVFDGIMEIVSDAPNGSLDWRNDNPWHAVQRFVASHPDFEVDPYYERLKSTYCPGGFLRRVGPKPS
jgi:cephalosporin hydroxylase